MCATAMVVSGLGVGLQAYGAYKQGKATEKAYSDQARINESNADYAEMQAEDALDRGRESERLHRQKVKGFKGTQRARLASSGVSLDEGSALNILTDTDYLGNEDALAIRENAQRESKGFKHQAKNFRMNASILADRAAAENPTGSALGVLLGGGGQVAGQWYTGSSMGAL